MRSRTCRGIIFNAGEGSARGDTVNLRGFPAFNDFFLDGIRDAAIYSRDSFNLELIEVLKGPSATTRLVDSATPAEPFAIQVCDPGDAHKPHPPLDFIFQ